MLYNFYDILIDPIPHVPLIFLAALMSFYTFLFVRGLLFTKYFKTNI